MSASPSATSTLTSPAHVKLVFQFNATDQLARPKRGQPRKAAPSLSSLPSSSLLSSRQRHRLFIDTRNLRSVQRPAAAVTVTEPPAAPLPGAASFLLPSSSFASAFSRSLPVPHPVHVSAPRSPLLLTASAFHSRYSAYHRPLPHYLHPAKRAAPMPSSASSSHFTPSSAMQRLSALLEAAAPSIVASTAAMLPRRPREGETSRVGALHLDFLCPAVIAKRAANAVLWPVSVEAADD